MPDLIYARAQMGLSLAFHIVFAAAGVALPVLMLLADFAYGRTGDADYKLLSEKLAKGTAVLFAVGAVSGTVLSFELGTLWPEFMKRFGGTIGLPFTLEGFAFFTEAIFLAIYLYGRERVSRRLHLAAGVVVAISGAASSFFVTLVNVFMNDPGPEQLGQSLGIPPLHALFSPGWPTETMHALLASYEAAAFAMVGIHAIVLLRHPLNAFHQKALRVALPLACLSALVQPVLGDLSAKHDAHAQPIKLAAMEGQFQTERGAPLRVGGIPDEATETTRHALEVPGALSFMAFDDFHAQVKGLDAFPRDQWPPISKVHFSFQAMVGAGSALAGLAVWTLGRRLLRKRDFPRPLLWSYALGGPLGWVALEAGWLVTEYGRQPWVVRGVMRTREAVTGFTPLAPSFFLFGAVYVGLAFVVVFLLGRQILDSVPTAEAKHVPA